MAVDVKDWLLTLAVINVIAEVDVSLALSAALYLLYVLLVQSVTIVPLAIRMIFPARAGVLLGAVNDRLEKHNRALTVAMLGLMGVIFIALGFEQLGMVKCEVCRTLIQARTGEHSVVLPKNHS